MGRDDYDYDDERTTRSTRQSTQRTERLDPEDIGHGEPVGSDWRRNRTSSRNRQVGSAFPRTREELVIWLQHQQGWRPVALVVIGLVAIIALAIIILRRMRARTRQPASLRCRPSANCPASFNRLSRP